MRAVNLLPKEESRSRERSRQTLPALVGAGLLSAVCLALAFLSLTQSTTANDRQVELATANTELSLLPPVPKPASAAESSLGDAQARRLAAVSAALGTRVAWDRLLRELSLVLPEDVWLVDLTATAPTAEAAPAADPAAAPTQLTLSGRTYSHAAVARLLSRLAVVPELTNVQLQRSALTELGTQQIVEFSIVAGIRSQGGAS